MAAVKQQLLGMGDAVLIEQVTGDGTADLLVTNHMEKIKSLLISLLPGTGWVAELTRHPELLWSCTVHSKPPCFHWPGGSLGRQYKLPLAEEQAKGPAAPGYLH